MIVVWLRSTLHTCEGHSEESVGFEAFLRRTQVTSLPLVDPTFIQRNISGPSTEV